MRNMKYSITFGIALVCVILFAACDNNIETPMSGYGRISISFAEPQTARTVLPQAVFNKYVYTFTKTGEQNGAVKVPDNDGFFTLEVGNYTVAVQAFTGNAEPFTLAASGVSPVFSVSPGNNDPVVVPLSGVVAGGQGEFSYAITYPAGATVEITLQKWPELDDIALGNGTTQTLQLEAGVYLFTVLISNNERYAGINEAVYIYSSLTTVYAKDFDEDDLLLSLYTVTFDANSATSGTAPNAQAMGKGSSITLPGQGTLVRTGFTLVGWNTNPSGTGTNYSVGSSYTPTGDITLYANWGYTVTFHANNSLPGGTPPTPQTVAAGSSITIPDQGSLTYSSLYIFAGWNTNSSGTGTNYSVGSSYTPTGDITLYANWGFACTVTFDGNYQTSGTPPAPQTVASGSSITIPDPGSLYSQSSDFICWSTSQDFRTGTIYSAGDSYRVTDNITLYAFWCRVFRFSYNWESNTMNNAPYFYTFNVTSGTTYYVWWNCRNAGDSTKTGDIKVSAYYSNKSSIFTNVYSAWSTPRQFTAGSTGRVIIIVDPVDYQSYGSFSITYSTSNTRPPQ